MLSQQQQGCSMHSSQCSCCRASGTLRSSSHSHNLPLSTTAEKTLCSVSKAPINELMMPSASHCYRNRLACRAPPPTWHLVRQVTLFLPSHQQVQHKHWRMQRCAYVIMNHHASPCNVLQGNQHRPCCIHGRDTKPMHGACEGSEVQSLLP